ncbi:MAG: NYN domain-containing protein [bacterium]|nr:NYN domain-containing protein [bacterium]
MIQRLLRRLLRPKGRAVKVIVDGENLFHSLKELKRGDIEVSELLASSKKILKRGEEIKEIYFFGTYREDDSSQDLFRKALKRNAGVKVIMKREKAIISGMTWKSRVDPYIIVEIMETTWQPEYGKIILYSGDSDFEAPLRKVKERRIKSVVISARNNLSRELKAAADEVIYLEDFLTKIAGEKVA